MAQRHSRQQIARAILEVIDDGGDRSGVARSIAGYLINEGRTKDLDSLMRDVMRLRAERGILEVTTTSAFPLADHVRAQIEDIARTMQSPDAQQVITSQNIDPSVLGGVRVETPTTLMDLTIRTRLNRLKQIVAKQERSVPRGLID